MSARSSAQITDGVAAGPAMLSGMQLAFVVATAVALVTVVVAALLPSRLPAGADSHGSIEADDIGHGELVTAER